MIVMMPVRHVLSVARAGALGCFLLACPAVGRSSTDPGDAPVVMVKNGEVLPVKNAPRKSLGETLYLSSIVRLKRPTVAASPSPTPKATPKAGTASSTPSVTVPKNKSRGEVSHASSKTAAQDAPITVRKSSKAPAGGSADDDPGDDYGKIQPKSDPLQSVNRGTFWFNHQLYHYVFTPLNKTYKTVFPQPVRTGLANVFANAEYPVRFVNDLLQWKPGRAGLETEKFLVNTTAGVGGIFRVSDKIPSLADVPQTDTAATFAKWGIPAGCYIVWPVLGPKNLRDTVGFAGDIALDPVTWITYGAVGGLAGATTLAVSAPETTAKTSDKIDTYETLTRTSIDRYNAVRSAYEQNRKKVESN